MVMVMVLVLVLLLMLILRCTPAPPLMLCSVLLCTPIWFWCLWCRLLLCLCSFCSFLLVRSSIKRVLLYFTTRLVPFHFNKWLLSLARRRILLAWPEMHDYMIIRFEW